MGRIVFTGGGSAGHVTPNLALIKEMQHRQWQVQYIGSYEGIERSIITEAGIPYHGISSGKLRRYADLNNLKDPFKVLKGLWQAYRLLGKFKADVVFSKGGFVAVPVVMAAWLRRIPVVIHESDLTPGLANKLSVPFASRVCVTFPETVSHIKGGKAVVTGLPIRAELLEGNPDRARRMLDFVRSRPVLLVMGGSLGARAINEALRQALDPLLSHFQIIHICGKGNLDPQLDGKRGYRQFEFVNRELSDMMALADVVVSRAGATSIFEFLALRKPMLLIPLSRKASRGDQILNARSFEKQGFAMVLEEEEMTDGQVLCQRIMELYNGKDRMVRAMEEAGIGYGATETIARLILEAAGS